MPHSTKSSLHYFKEKIVMSALYVYTCISCSAKVYKYKKQLDEVGMVVPKSTQIRFIGITYHIHYTSLCLLISIISCHTYYHKCRGR